MMFQGPKCYIAQIFEVYSCSMETVQQNGRFTFFSSKFHCNVYSIFFDSHTCSKNPNREATRSQSAVIFYKFNLLLLLTVIFRRSLKGNFNPFSRKYRWLMVILYTIKGTVSVSSSDLCLIKHELYINVLFL